MKYDLKQVNEADTRYEEDKIIKLGICLLNDEDIYGKWVGEKGKEVLEIPDRPFFYINDDKKEHPIYLNKDGCYEFSNEDNEDLNITSFEIPKFIDAENKIAFPPFTAEYVVEIGQK